MCIRDRVEAAAVIASQPPGNSNQSGTGWTNLKSDSSSAGAVSKTPPGVTQAKTKSQFHLIDPVIDPVIDSAVGPTVDPTMVPAVPQVAPAKPSVFPTSDLIVDPDLGASIPWPTAQGETLQAPQVSNTPFQMLSPIVAPVE